MLQKAKPHTIALAQRAALITTKRASTEALRHLRTLLELQTADYSLKGENLLQYAARRNYPTPNIKLITKYIDDVDCVDCYGYTPIIYCIENGRGIAVRALLAAGADPTQTTIDGLTLLKLAHKLRDRVNTGIVMEYIKKKKNALKY